MRRYLAMGASGGATILGCAAIVGIETTTTITSPDAVPPASDGDATIETPVEDPDADILVPSIEDPDAGLLVEDAGTEPDAASCKLGAREAYEPFVSGVVVNVCNPGAALNQGGSFTGLDCYGAGVHTIDTKSSTACVAVDYGTPNLASFTVRMFSVEKGCLYTCYSGDCGSRMVAHVFAGTARDVDSWRYLGTAETKRSPANFNFTMPSGNWKVIGICRSGYGASRDDIAVDGIVARCR